jgi:hypothetical protein
MTRSHGKHHVTATPPPPAPAPAEANGAEPRPPQTEAGGANPVFRVVMWIWALAFIALIVQAFLDFIFGALFGPAGR